MDYVKIIVYVLKSKLDNKNYSYISYFKMYINFYMFMLSVCWKLMFRLEERMCVGKLLW